jgi:hypothetical protein
MNVIDNSAVLSDHLRERVAVAFAAVPTNDGPPAHAGGSGNNQNGV